jgi:hypothetical protein
MFEILLPLRKRLPLFVCEQKEVPWALRGYVAGAFGQGAINVGEIGHIYGGRNARPTKPLLLYGPRGEMTIVVGGGEAEAAELEDLAHAALEKQTRRASGDRVAELRERRGLPTREQGRVMMQEALREHGRRQIAHPSNFPKRQKPDRSWVKKLPEIPVG